MPKAIRLKLFQQMPNYKKTSAVVIKESYPLPPYSTVIGMLHSVCDFKEYHPMRVSIQGNHASDIAEIETQYVFGIKYDASRHQLKVPSGVVKDNKMEYDGITRTPRSIQFLTDVNLCIHIMPENPEDLEVIYNSLLNPMEYISLGRREDIARIDEVSIVDLQQDDGYSDYITKYSAYCPYSYMQDVSTGEIKGTIYKIPKVFNTNTKDKRRKWQEIVTVRYIEKDISINTEILENKNVFLDDNIPVFFAWLFLKRGFL